MRKSTDSDAGFITQKDKLVAYLMNFSLKSYQAIRNQDSETLWGLCEASAREIYDYQRGNPLPTTPGEAKRPQNHGWRLV